MNYDRIDSLIKELEKECATLKEVAQSAGFRCCNVTLELNPIMEGPPKIRLYLSREGQDAEQISAPTVKDAYEEAARRLNWQRDINMRLISHE